MSRRKKAERHRRSSGLTVDKEIYDLTKKTVTTIVHNEKCAYYSAKIAESSKTKHTTQMSTTITIHTQCTSDHFTMVCDLDFFVPSPPPMFICKKKLSSIDNCILMQDIKQCLHSTVTFTAA